MLLVAGWLSNSPEDSSHTATVSAPASDPTNDRDLTSSPRAALIAIAGRLLLGAAATSFYSFIRSVGSWVHSHLLRSILGIAGWARVLDPVLRLPGVLTLVRNVTNTIVGGILSIYTAALAKSCEYLEGQGYSCAV